MKRGTMKRTMVVTEYVRQNTEQGLREYIEYHYESEDGERDPVAGEYWASTLDKRMRIALGRYLRTTSKTDFRFPSRKG